jgi:hypothetical protein
MNSFATFLAMNRHPPPGGYARSYAAAMGFSRCYDNIFSIATHSFSLLVNKDRL